MPLVEGDGTIVAGLHMQVCGLDGRVLSCQPQRAAQQVAACGVPRSNTGNSIYCFLVKVLYSGYSSNPVCVQDKCNSAHMQHQETRQHLPE